MMNLLQWGFSANFSQPLESGEIFARVLEEQKTLYRLATEQGELLGHTTGKLALPTLTRLDRPVVGDWVVVRPLWQEKKAVIHRILPRKTLLRRKAAGETEEIQPLAANVELAIVVTSLNREFNEARLHRYLSVIQESGAGAAILLTKLDLAPESREQAKLLAAKYRVPCIAICSLTKEGMEEARALLLPQKTCVFVGSSGVGKSTLVNALLGREEQETGKIRDTDDRGRHTTTSRRLIQLPSQALVIDTPGMREIQLESAFEKGLSLAFAEIERRALACKFQNCRHETEPKCAVKAAMEAGEVLSTDLASYIKLRKEAESNEAKAIRAADTKDKKRSRGYLVDKREEKKSKSGKNE